MHADGGLVTVDFDGHALATAVLAVDIATHVTERRAFGVVVVRLRTLAVLEYKAHLLLKLQRGRKGESTEHRLCLFFQE